MATSIVGTTRPALASLAPEDQLLIRGSQSHLDSAARAEVRALLAQALDWDYVLNASIRHNVAPLFYYGLNQVANDTPRHAELERLYHDNRARNQRLYRVIAEVARAFARASIPALGLKDVQLARQVYPDLGLRPMGDIDILIRQEDYARAARELHALGFMAPISDMPFTRKYAWGHHFRREADHIWLDLQWNIVQREWDVYGEGNFDFEIERIWRNARGMSLGDTAILVPKPEDMLVHLCQHLEGHKYGELILFCDIAELIRHYATTLDWDYIVRLAQKYDACATLYYVLGLVARFYPGTLPPNLLNQLEPTYFQANLFAPLYESLIDQHVELDQIYTFAQPPEPTLAAFERTTRRRVHGAMQAYRALDQFAKNFVGAGGQVLIFDGRAVETAFPDPALPAFEEIQVYILEQELPTMRQALGESEFAPEADHGTECYSKHWQAQSADPALDSATVMTVEVRIQTDLAALLNAPQRDLSTRAVALESLGGKLRGRGKDEASLRVPLTVWALAPDDLLCYLLARLGQAEQTRLFALVSALQFLRRYSGPINWDAIMRQADEHALTAVCKGTEILAAFTDDARLLQAPGRCAEEHPHVLAFARYNATWGQYAAFRAAFLSLFTLLSIGGVANKIKYVVRSPLLGQIVHGAKAFIRRKEKPAHESAYWIEQPASANQ